MTILTRTWGVLAILAMAGCVGSATTTSSPDPEPATTSESTSEPALESPLADDGPAFVATPAVDPGFTHCCGTADYKMEVECGDRLKRCYIQEDGVWKQTYGRHCRQALGDSCYLHICDDACDG